MNYRDFFPTLKNNPNLIFFDNASGTPNPQNVIDLINKLYD